MTLLELEIRAALRRYLSGAASLEAFEDWLIDATEDLDHRTPVFRLVAAVNRQIAEYTGGFMNESQLQARLEPLAPAWIPIDQKVETVVMRLAGRAKSTLALPELRIRPEAAPA